MSDSIFRSVTELPADVVLGTAVAYQNDKSPDKVNLGIGAYRTEEGNPYVFNIVRQVENDICYDTAANKEYLRESGLASLKKLTQELVFGNSSDDRICSVQSLSGTGAIHLAATFIKHTGLTAEDVYVSKPTWPNHYGIFQLTGFRVREYQYWDQDMKSCNIRKMVEGLQNAPPRSIIVLHACAHNPTGEDPSEDEWNEILQACIDRQHIPLIDFAYQGFASGDVIKDRSTVQLFYQSGMEFFVAQSFAKNMGLYGERIGMLHVVTSNAERVKAIETHLRFYARRIYSNPPIHGALLVEKLLNDENHKRQWLTELSTVSQRILNIRKDLRDGLVAKGTPGDWDHITKQIGMFSFTGLTPEQCGRMTSIWHIYMLMNGRISLAGLNKSNIQHVTNAIDDCVRHSEQMKA